MMRFFGLESIQAAIEAGGYQLKLIAHEQAVAFFPRTCEHREMKVQGLSYEDDSKGNALAGMMSPGRIDFRHHRAFTDERVRTIALAILNHPELRFARAAQVTYQGRTIVAGQEAGPTGGGD